MKNGTVTILGPSTNLNVIDVKVTNSFPLIALPRGSKLLLPGSAIEDIDNYQHFSIPKDLRVHRAPRITPAATARTYRSWAASVSLD